MAQTRRGKGVKKNGRREECLLMCLSRGVRQSKTFIKKYPKVYTDMCVVTVNGYEYGGRIFLEQYQNASFKRRR